MPHPRCGIRGGFRGWLRRRVIAFAYRIGRLDVCEISDFRSPHGRRWTKDGARVCRACNSASRPASRKKEAGGVSGGGDDGGGGDVGGARGAGTAIKVSINARAHTMRIIARPRRYQRRQTGASRRRRKCSYSCTCICIRTRAPSSPETSDSRASSALVGTRRARLARERGRESVGERVSERTANGKRAERCKSNRILNRLPALRDARANVERRLVAVRRLPPPDANNCGPSAGRRLMGRRRQAAAGATQFGRMSRRALAPNDYCLG